MESTKRPSVGTSAGMWKSFAGLVISAAALTVAITGAVFTDTQTVGSNAFSTGVIDISTNPTSALVAFPNMMPGHQSNGTITVTNSGTGANDDLRYALTSTTTENTLAAQLQLTVWAEASEGDGGAVCDFNYAGTKLWDAGDLGSTTGTNIVGNPAQGGDAGDRTLDQAASEVLCFKVLLPTSSDNSYQNLSTTATFAFVAEQTANN